MWSRPPRDGDATLINLAETNKVYRPRRDFDQDRLRELRPFQPMIWPAPHNREPPPFAFPVGASGFQLLP
jgi:hypothetical protein